MRQPPTYVNLSHTCEASKALFFSMHVKTVPFSMRKIWPLPASQHVYLSYKTSRIVHHTTIENLGISLYGSFFHLEADPALALPEQMQILAT